VYGGSWKKSSLPYSRYTLGTGSEYAQITGDFTDLYGVFHLHPWSGVASVDVNGVVTQEIDLFSTYPHDLSLPLYGTAAQGLRRTLSTTAPYTKRLGGASLVSRLRSISSRRFRSVLSGRQRRVGRAILRIVATGRRNPLARSTEVVFRGFDSTAEVVTGDWSEGDIMPPPIKAAPAFDPEGFAALQRSHIDRWRAAQEGSNYAALQEDRTDRYVQKYFRASVFFGQRLLDIGSGYVPREILDMLSQRGVEYDCLDIDDRVVDYLKNELAIRGMRGSARTSEIGTVQLDPENYDAVFASHTIEHSSSIMHSLEQVFNTLRSGGYFIMAVPLGWDDSEEHVNSFSVDEWVMAVQTAGFDVLSSEVAKLYDPRYYDVTIVAQKPRT